MSEDITKIEINNNQDFILENFQNYKNLESLILKDILITEYTTINKLFDTLDFTKLKTLYCNFIYITTNIQIKLVNGDVVLEIPTFDASIKTFLTNLPHNIDKININFMISDYLEGCFTNLPPTIKEIKINYSITQKSADDSGYYNFLFNNVRLPFGCKMIVSHSKDGSVNNYIVSYENNEENELILVSEDNQDIKIVIKYKEPMIHIYDRNYNVLRIMSGMPGLGYSS